MEPPAQSCNDRLHKAISTAEDIIDAVYANNSENRVAVSGFNSVLTNESFTFLEDAQTAKSALNNLPSKYAGATNYTNAINGANARLSEEGVVRSGTQQLVIIISDGVPSSNDAGSVLTDDENYNGIAAAEALKAKGIDVLTVGVGNTVDGMQVYQSNGTLSGSLTTLLAQESSLEALGIYDKSDTWNNIRTYLGMPVAPAITENLPSNILAVSREKVTLNVKANAANGDGLSYRWYRNGSVIAGANSASYTFSAKSSMDGDVIYVEVINSMNGKTASVKSSSTTLSVTQTQAYDIVL
ncbi:MAG: VWA domain-containing protein [Lachnospiraceae bacterium]